MKKSATSSGFSLVEVNLAILLVSFGLLALFALFPAGLREADSALSDTHAAFFGDYVVSGIEANASTITNYDIWLDYRFKGKAIEDLLPDASPPLSIQDYPASTISPAVSFSGNKLRYILETAVSGRTRTISLWVASGEYGTSDITIFKQSGSFFCTELYYQGEMQ